MKKIIVCPEDDLQKIFDNITEPCEIFLKNGVYNQKTVLNASCVTLKGESREGVVLRYDDYATKIHADGRIFQTFRTYTLCVTGENVRLENLTVENCADPSGGQCVALSVICKKFYAENVDLKSHQDTVFLAPFPIEPIIKDSELVPPDWLNMKGYDAHIFKNCRIYGTVDFIFGCAEAYFKDCEIISLESRNGGYIAAPAHPLSQKTGFYFIDCKLTDGGAKGNVYLARPWRDYGLCAFLDCKADGHLADKLVNKWNDSERDKTARFYYGNIEGFCGHPEPWAKALSEDEKKSIRERYEKKLAGVKNEA